MRGMKFYVYFIAVAFALLWGQGVLVAGQEAQEQRTQQAQVVLTTATQVYFTQESPKLNRIGIMSWCVVALGFGGVSVAAAVNCGLFGRRYQNTKDRSASGSLKNSYLYKVPPRCYRSRVHIRKA